VGPSRQQIKEKRRFVLGIELLYVTQRLAFSDLDQGQEHPR